MGTIIMAAMLMFSTNTALVEDVAQDYGLPIVYTVVENDDWRVVDNRTEDELIVQVVESTSYGGRYGEDPQGYVIAYNVDVPQGNQVTSYIVYSPYSQEPDDVVAVIDNGIMGSPSG